MHHVTPFRLILLAAIALCLTACSKTPIYQQESYVFGTRVEIQIAELEEPQARPAVAAVLQEFDRLHRTYHAWHPSELSELNAAIAAGKAHPVSAEMATLVSEAQSFARQSEGLFDPGIGRLIGLWGFQSDEFKPALPDPQALAAWRTAKPGIGKLRIENQQIRSTDPQVALDFGGYLKGIALDHAAEILRAQGIHNALINIGGNVMALGSKNGQRWLVGIQHPRQPGPLATIELNDGEAIGTSGDYQRYFELDGKRYCHLLDPQSGEPVTHTQALTVLISPGQAAGTRSDVASKPLFIAGADWPRMARKMNVNQILRVDASGQIQVSAALNKRLRFTDEDLKNIEILP